jgi:DNA-directed RNA polymerase subunit RPC12/RpoP
MNVIVATGREYHVPGSSEYECGECRHRFRTPEGAPRDTRSLMCPACGSIDLNLMTVARPSPAVWTAREGATAEDRRKLDESAVS